MSDKDAVDYLVETLSRILNAALNGELPPDNPRAYYILMVGVKKDDGGHCYTVANIGRELMVKMLSEQLGYLAAGDPAAQSAAADGDAEAARMRRDAARAQRKALRFYADPENWKKVGTRDAAGDFLLLSAVQKDGGEIARTAIGWPDADTPESAERDR